MAKSSPTLLKTVAGAIMLLAYLALAVLAGEGVSRLMGL
jgi:hypothetical protein